MLHAGLDYLTAWMHFFSKWLSTPPVLQTQPWEAGNLHAGLALITANLTKQQRKCKGLYSAHTHKHTTPAGRLQHQAAHTPLVAITPSSIAHSISNATWLSIPAVLQDATPGGRNPPLGLALIIAKHKCNLSGLHTFEQLPRLKAECQTSSCKP